VVLGSFAGPFKMVRLAMPGPGASGPKLTSETFQDAAAQPVITANRATRSILEVLTSASRQYCRLLNDRYPT